MRLTNRLQALERAGDHSRLGEWLDAIGGNPPDKPMHPDLKAALDALPDSEGTNDEAD